MLTFTLKYMCDLDIAATRLVEQAYSASKYDTHLCHFISKSIHK